jgi:hypothetical protein
MLEEYPEATIVAAVGRFRKVDGDRHQGHGIEKAAAAAIAQVDGERTALRVYVDSCLVAAHGAGALPSPDVERAFRAACELHPQ